jgi:hypothetical protein
MRFLKGMFQIGFGAVAPDCVGRSTLRLTNYSA